MVSLSMNHTQTMEGNFQLVNWSQTEGKKNNVLVAMKSWNRFRQEGSPGPWHYQNTAKSDTCLAKMMDTENPTLWVTVEKVSLFHSNCKENQIQIQLSNRGKLHGKPCVHMCDQKVRGQRFLKQVREVRNVTLDEYWELDFGLDPAAGRREFIRWRNSWGVSPKTYTKWSTVCLLCLMIDLSSSSEGWVSLDVFISKKTENILWLRKRTALDRVGRVLVLQPEPKPERASFYL